MLGLLLAVFGLLQAPTAAAQVPPVVPAFPNDLNCTPGQLLHREVGLGRITNIVYHNQVLYSNNVAANARREWRFTDPADPTSLTMISEDQLDAFMDQGNHSHAKSGDWIMSRWGARIRRQSPGVNVEEQMPPDERFWQVQETPAGGGLHNIYWPWSMPFNWLQYGATPGQGRLWRADELLAEWEPLADDGVAGNGILVGNLLIMVSDASMLGVVAYDIGPTFNDPPEPPRVLDKLTGPFGAYIGSVWENYLVLAGGDPRDLVYVIDYSDPTDLRLVTTMDLSGNPDLNAGTNVPYVQTQDRYVFTRRHKIDMETLTPVLELDEVGDNRPAGSVAGELGVSQYTLPIGNLLITGAYSASGRDGIGVWCHDAAPDRTAPYVGYHVPRPGQTQYPIGAPISLLIHEELESYTIINGETVIVRPVGGAPVDAWVSFAHDGILTITPKQYLEPDTEYEVVVVQDGIKDVANNGIDGYSFTFSTGSDINAGNRAPTVDSFTAGPSPASTGQTVTIAATGSDPENDPIEYRFNYGDGTPYTAWGSANQFQHVYPQEGHFEVKVQIRDLKPDGTRSTVTETLTVTVADLPSGPLPTHSSTIALDEAGRRLWVVNPDHGTVARLNADTGALLGQTDLDLFNEEASRPMSVAVAPNGEAWVALSGTDEVVVVNPSGGIVERIDTGFGSAPQAVAMRRDGAKVFVSTRGGAAEPGHGRLLRFDRATRALDDAVDLGPSAGAIAVTGDGSRVFVARFLSAKDFGEIWEVDGNAMNLTRTLDLYRDRGRSGIDAGGSDGPGVPNHIAGLTLSPQEDWLWYTGLKMDTNRGVFFDQGVGNNLPLAHDSTVRAVLGRFDMNDPSGEPREPGRTSTGPDRGRIDIDNSESPSALVFSPRGDYVFTTLQGNNAVAALDDLQIRAGSGRTTLWRVTTGGAPRGLVFDPATDSVWVQNFTGRTVSRVEVGGFLASGDRTLPNTSFTSVTGEPLPGDVLVGKRLFFFAGNDPLGQNPMSFEGYISCASCHQDGSQDGRVWDFTQRGEGFRNTTDLRGRAGMVHGNVHWSGNFDEIQDFIIDIVFEFGGLGFLPSGETPNPSLGAPNAGRSVTLDALAAYVASLDRTTIPRSPYRAPDGSFTAAAVAGAGHFEALGCAGCHDPVSGYTDSFAGPALHDVGTIRTSSGFRLGDPLTGIDTPTLMGIWETAPYFHDGSAETLAEVFRVAGGTQYEAENAQLGSAEVVNFSHINQDSTFHGDIIRFNGDGATVTFSGVDGGSGGVGAVELRYSAGRSGQLSVIVNGTPVGSGTVVDDRTRLEWLRLRFEDVPLNAGTANTVVVRRDDYASSNGPFLDNVVVTTADHLDRAQVHRVAQSLSASEQDQLLAYLRSIDGRDINGNLAERGLIFRDGMEN